MGGVKDALFGKQGHSGNENNKDLEPVLMPGVSYVTQGGNLMGNLLGVNGAPAQTDALTNFANSGGMKFLQDQGQKMVTSSKAAQGLLKSGSYGTALQQYGQGLASTYLNQYMKDLTDFSQLGLGSAGILASTGQNSSTPKQGLLQAAAGNPGTPGAIAGGGGDAAAAGA